MLPLSDGIPARRFPLVTVAIIGRQLRGLDGGGTAFFAHVGGFVFGVLVATRFAGAAVRQPQLEGA